MYGCEERFARSCDEARREGEGATAPASHQNAVRATRQPKTRNVIKLDEFNMTLENEKCMGTTRTRGDEVIQLYNVVRKVRH